MHRLLFILPSIHIGGTTSVLISMLNSFDPDEISIDIFPIMDGNLDDSVLSEHVVGNNWLTTAFYGNYSSLGMSDKTKSLPIRLLKQIPWINKIIERIVVNHTISNIRKKSAYDYIVSFQEGLATRFTSYIKGCRKIAWIHCDYANNYTKNTEEGELYNSFCKIVCVSDYTKKGFVGQYPFLLNKTYSIHNLFDTQRILKLSKDGVDDVNISKDSFTILSVGRISRVKRFSLIPKIAKELSENNIHFKWYIIGSVAETAEFNHLIEEIKINDVSDYVIYLGAKTNPYPFFIEADLLVTLSQSEACPMIFNEAKVLNLPILSTNFGSSYEFIDQGIDGFIVPIEDISQKITQLYREPEILKRIKNPKERIDENDTIIEQVKNIFKL